MSYDYKNKRVFVRLFVLICLFERRRNKTNQNFNFVKEYGRLSLPDLIISMLLRKGKTEKLKMKSDENY